MHIGSMLFAGKRYAAEVYPDKEVWGYADLAEVAFGTVGKVTLTHCDIIQSILCIYVLYPRCFVGSNQSLSHNGG